MGTKPVAPLLLGMAFPIMISMLVQALYNIVDSIFVARLSDAALAAVSFAYPVQMLTIAVAVGTSVGVNALLSRRLGEGNREAADKVAHNGMLLMFFSWLAFAVFGLFCSELFFSFFTTNPAIAADGAAYLRVCLVFSLGMFFQICLERLIQVTGRTVFQMLSQMSGAIVNIILDPILIFGLLGAPKLGVGRVPVLLCRNRPDPNAGLDGYRDTGQRFPGGAASSRDCGVCLYQCATQ